jgi:hypothetical protein
MLKERSGFWLEVMRTPEPSAPASSGSESATVPLTPPETLTDAPPDCARATLDRQSIAARNRRGRRLFLKKRRAAEKSRFTLSISLTARVTD